MLAARFGLERSLAVSMPLFVTYFLTLAAMATQPWLFWISWILLTLFKIFYWPAYHTEMIRYGDTRNRGTELSWVFALTEGVGVLGPMIGGLVATYFGFSMLFVLAAGLALFAIVPLVRTREHFQPEGLAYHDPWLLMLSRTFRPTLLTMIGWGENLIDLVFWPVFMFIVVGGADVLGYIATINILCMTLFGFFVGEISDRFSRQKILRVHLPFMALGYLLRPLATTGLRVLLTDSLAKVALIGVRIPQMYRLYVKGRASGALRYVLAMEMTLSITKCLLALSLAGVFLVLPPTAAFTAAFTIAAAFSLLYVFL
jgi:MFS family permease